MVMGPAAAKVGEPCEGWSIAGRKKKAKCQRWQKRGGLLQRPTGFMDVFVQARKTPKAAGTKSEHGGKNCPRNMWWIFALQPCVLLCLTQQLRAPALWIKFPCSPLALLFCSKCNFKDEKPLMTLDEFTLKKRLTSKAPGGQPYTVIFKLRLYGCGSTAPPVRCKWWLWRSRQAEDAILPAHPSLLLAWKKAEVWGWYMPYLTHLAKQSLLSLPVRLLTLFSTQAGMTGWLWGVLAPYKLMSRWQNLCRCCKHHCYGTEGSQTCFASLAA